MATKSISVERPDKKNRARLMELEGLAQALLRSAGLGIYIVQEGKFQYVNPLFQGLTGYTEEELLGTYSLNLVHPEDREAVRKKAIENLKGRATYPYEYRLVKKNGDLMWVLENIVTTEYKGRPAAVGSFMDITERRQVEEALRESEERYSQLYHNINEAVALYRLPDLKISHWNKRYEDIHKLLLTKDIEDVTISDIASVVEADDWDRAMEGFVKTLAGEPVPDVDVYEIRMRDLEGKRLVLEVRPSFYKEKDKVVGIQVAMADITERRQIEEALKESETRFRTIIEYASDGILVADLETKRFYTGNKAICQMLGYTMEEIRTLSVPDIHPKKDLPYVMGQFEKQSKGESTLTGDIPVKRKDGSVFYADVSTSVLTFNGRTYLGGIFRDTTERKQSAEEREGLLRDIRKINQKLEESNKELQDFAYIASHDLREPLRKISSFGALLQDSLQGKLDEDQQENFEFMIDGSQRMQEMIDALLTYSRLTTRAKPPQRVDLNEVIEDLKKLEMATLLDETQGTIHVPEPLLPVQADLSQMRQLFQNLIGNGLKFHKKGIPPEISIRAHQVENNMIRIEVEDNGIGIDEEYYEQIFVMFKRLHSREQYEGTGIGLAICKKIVERHGGNIGVKSTPGEGSTFWFTLPRGSYSRDS